VLGTSRPYNSWCCQAISPTTFICSQWWKSDFSAKGFSHPHRSVERSALAIASAILFMPSGRFEPKPA
jgi:hypothetical protein